MKIHFANQLRGLAALMVLISHHYGVFWGDNERIIVAKMINAPVLDIKTPFFIQYLWKLPNYSWGLCGVAIFFLISGFIIPFSLKKYSLNNFLTARLFRIFPTYMVGFSITLLSIYFASKYFNRPWPFSSQQIIIHFFPGLRDILDSIGIDGIIWTLEIEIKFYVLCAIFIKFFKRSNLYLFFIPIFLFLTSLTINFLMNRYQFNAVFYRFFLIFLFNSQYIIYMFIGVALHYLFEKKISNQKACVLILLFFSLFLIQWKITIYKESFMQFVNYVIALVIFLSSFVYRSKFNENNFFNFLAKISYPLYVSHGVFGYVLLRILIINGFNPIFSLLGTTLICLLNAFLIHKYVELPMLYKTANK